MWRVAVAVADEDHIPPAAAAPLLLVAAAAAAGPALNPKERSPAEEEATHSAKAPLESEGSLRVVATTANSQTPSSSSTS